MPILHVHNPEASVNEQIVGPYFEPGQLLAGMALYGASVEVLEPGFQGIITPECWSDGNIPNAAIAIAVSEKQDSACVTIYQSLTGLSRRGWSPDCVDDVEPSQQKFLPHDSDFFRVGQLVPWKLHTEIGALVLHRNPEETKHLQAAFSSSASRYRYIQNICPNIATLLE